MIDVSPDEKITEYPTGGAQTLAAPTMESPQDEVVTGLRVRHRWVRWAIPLAVFMLALIPRLLGLEVFLTADEDDQLRFASGFLTAVLAGDWARAVLLGYPGVPTMAFGGLGLGLRYLLHTWGLASLPASGPDLASTLSHVTDYPLAYIQAARLPMVAAASLAVLGMYLLMRRLLGGRTAFVAALFIAFDPLFMANSRILHVDAPLAYFMFLSFLAFFLYLREGLWRWLALSGVMGALATLSKTPGAILGPILVVTGLIYALHPLDGRSLPGGEQARSNADQSARRRFVVPGGWRRFIVAIGVWSVVAVVAFYALWPSMWADPGRALHLIVQNARIAMRTTHPSSGVFWGPTRSDQNPLYYLISLLFHLSPLTMIGMLVGVVVTWRWRRYRVLLLALWVYAIIFIALVSIVGRRGDRYILPIYLPLDLLAAIVLSRISESASQRISESASQRVGESASRRVSESANQQFRNGVLRNTQHLHRTQVQVYAIQVILLFILILPTLLTYPYYFTYFNPLVGGGLTAPYLINVGWGEGLDRAATYLNRAPDASRKTVAAWYSFQFAPFYKGHTVDLSSNEPALTADYAVFYINQVQRGFPSQELLFYFQDRRPMHTVRLGGVDYAWIYPGPVVSAEPPTLVEHPVGAVLGGAIRLIGYSLAQPTIRADDDLSITLYWESLSPVREDYNVYVRLVDEVGNVWGQVDRLPLGGLWRTSQWQPGTYVQDEYRLSLRPGAPPGVYHLEAAMYSFATGDTFGVARNMGQVRVTPSRRTTRPDEITMQHTLRTSVAPGLELMGYDLGAEKVGPGGRLPVTLYWRATRPLDTDYLVGLDARSVAGNEGGSWLEYPASEYYPTSQWRWGEVLVDVHQLQMPANARSGFYLLSLRLVDEATDTQVSDRVILGKLEFVERARNFETPQAQYPVGVDLGDIESPQGMVQLIGYDLPQESVAAGESFPLTLYWRALSEMDTSYTVFTHVVGPDGAIRGQWDSVPGSGTLPTTGWLEGEVITDEYLVPMADDAPPWQYTILVGMYNPMTGERLRVMGAGDRDSVTLGVVQTR